MSIDWWSRKILGGYVYHGRKFKSVDNVTLRRGVKDSLWPEEIEGQVIITLNSGEKVSISDARFKFPEDQWKLVSLESESVTCYGTRDTSRKRWRIVPGEETYSRSHPAVTGEQWLNAPAVDIVDRSHITRWRDTSPQFYSSQLMSEQINPFIRVIRLGTMVIMELRRSPTEQELIGRVQHIPDHLKTGWGLTLNTPVPYDRMSPKNRRLYEDKPPTPPTAMNFVWTRRPEAQLEVQDFDYWWISRASIIRDQVVPAHFLQVALDGDTWSFAPEDALDAGPHFDLDILADIQILLERGPEG